MEEKIFIKPAVAGELKKKYVEARLHYDTGPRIDENKKLQGELAKSPANPYYVIVDPQTGKVLRKVFGLMSAEKFLEFLRGEETEEQADPMRGGGGR